jgi:hypothetical protein
MDIEVQIPEQRGLPAFGETLGVDVPTRYDSTAHATVNTLMIADSLITPVLLGMSGPTVWTCRAIAALLFITRTSSVELPLRRQLEIEAATGIGLIFLALRGQISKKWFENAYLFAGGVMMVANSLMTEVDPQLPEF